MRISRRDHLVALQASVRARREDIYLGLVEVLMAVFGLGDTVEEWKNGDGEAFEHFQQQVQQLRTTGMPKIALYADASVRAAFWECLDKGGQILTEIKNGGTGRAAEIEYDKAFEALIAAMRRQLGVWN